MREVRSYARQTRAGKRRGPSFSVALICTAISFVAAGCATTRVVGIPPPPDHCPTAEDADRLGILLPRPSDPDDAVEMSEFGMRWVRAGAYCQVISEALE